MFQIIKSCNHCCFFPRYEKNICYFSKTFENMQIFGIISIFTIWFHSLTCMVESRIFRIDPADRVTKEFWQHCLFILKFRSHALGNALMPSGFIKLWRLVLRHLCLLRLFPWRLDMTHSGFKWLKSAKYKWFHKSFQVLYAPHYNPLFVDFSPIFWSSFMYCDLWPYVWLLFKSGF